MQAVQFKVDLANHFLVEILISNPDKEDKSLVLNDIGAIDGTIKGGQINLSPTNLLIEHSHIAHRLLRRGSEGLQEVSVERQLNVGRVN